jgi:lysozyme
MKTSEKGQTLIKKTESFEPRPYRCPANIPSIGFGTTRYPNGKAVTMYDPAITLEQANAYFAHDIERFERDVLSLVKVPITQGQFDALVSFAYNCGSDIDKDTIAEGLGDSTLLKKLNAGDYKGAADEFLKWNKGAGKVQPGLVKRRAAEREMFLA